MGKKKKRATEAGLNPSHRTKSPFESDGSELAVVEADNQLDHPVEVKEEPRIKEEPQSVGELVDIPVPVPTRNNRVVVPSFGVDQSNGKYDFDSLDWDDAKIEVKEEIEVKKEKESKTNDELSGDAMANQRDLQQPSRPDENILTQSGSGHGAKNKESCGKVDVPKNVLKKHKCDVCEYSTNYKGHLNQHFLKHTGEKPHGCTLCPKRFTTKQNLRSHMKAHVEEFLFYCSDCLQGFDGKEEKTEHETYCKIRRYECHLCKESFCSLKTKMVTHMRVHSGDKPFECEECPKKFSQNYQLKAHMITHITKLPFKCLICHRGFLKNEKRKAHQRNCNGRYYECHLCKKLFRSSNEQLKGHMHTHSGEKPFRCNLCRTTFTLKSNLNKHMKTIHRKQY